MSTSFTNLTGFSSDEFTIPPNQRMGEEEFVVWALRERAHAELVANAVVMTLPQSQKHAELRLWLLCLLCEVNHSGRLGMNTLVRTGPGCFRIPDIFFVAKDRGHIIGDTMLREPPDLVVEIVSPDSSARDWREKYLEYEEFGIREYWVIDPAATSFEIYRLDEAGKYQHVDVVDGVFHSTVIAGLWLKAEWFAPAHRPTVREALCQLGVL